MSARRVRHARFLRLLSRLPAVAAVRLARRGADGGSDVYPVPRPLNAAPSGAGGRAGALRVAPLPFGSSVVLAARKAAT
jgi:hypothetical protein